jgi:hypothetical protein
MPPSDNILDRKECLNILVFPQPYRSKGEAVRGESLGEASLMLAVGRRGEDRIEMRGTLLRWGEDDKVDMEPSARMGGMT